MDYVFVEDFEDDAPQEEGCMDPMMGSPPDTIGVALSFVGMTMNVYRPFIVPDGERCGKPYEPEMPPKLAAAQSAACNALGAYFDKWRKANA